MREDNPTLVVHHHQPMKAEIRLVPIATLEDGEIRVRIDKFGLTSNNVTYAALGRQLHYFEFFPVDGPWSALPVWGLATVIASRAPDVPEGSRIYGYLPAAREATLRVSATTQSGFRVDRSALPPQHALYGQYSFLDRDPFYLAAQEDLMMVMRPLFLTGLLLTDYLLIKKRLGADALLISSAASKTSYGLACALRAAGESQVMGLASARSKSAASALGLYDPVLSYDELAALDPSRSIAYVDVAGSGPVRRRLAQQLGKSLLGIISVGLTHWSEGGYDGKDDVGVPVETFFAPGWGARRQKESGAQFFAQMSTGWLAQIESAQRHFRIVHMSGAEALAASFTELVEGRGNPEQAYVHTL